VWILAEERLFWHGNHNRGALPSIINVDGTLIVDCLIQHCMNFDQRRFLGMDGKAPPLSCEQISDHYITVDSSIVWHSRLRGTQADEEVRLF